MHAQEIKANVSINMEQLSFESRNQVATMENDLARYINNQKFTNIEWKGDPIPVDIIIYLSGGTSNKYSAKLVIASKRTLMGPEENAGQALNMKFYDPNWSFTYGMGSNFTFNTMRYDEFSTLIDYYMSLIIGFDLDTYGELDGTPAFDQARNFVILGASSSGAGFSTNSSPGEFSRYNLTTDLLDMRYHPLRKLIFAYYVDGLDLMHQNKPKAMANIADIIEKLADFKQKKMVGPSVLLQSFFDSKATEISTIFNGYKNDRFFNNLIYIDPTNATLYNDAKEGKYK